MRAARAVCGVCAVCMYRGRHPLRFNKIKKAPSLKTLQKSILRTLCQISRGQEAARKRGVALDGWRTGHDTSTMPVVGYNGPSFNTRLGDRNGMSRPESRPGRDSDLYQETETHDEFGRRKEFVGTGWKTGGDRIEYKNSKGSPPTMAEIAAANNRGRARATHSSIGALITYGASDNFLPSKQGTPSAQSPSPQKSAKAAVNLMLSTDESTMPGDLLVRKSGLPIAKRMAALIRQRSLDMHLLINDYLQRTPASKMGPQRGHAFIDIATFRRALCYAFGEQWTILGMTTAELVETCTSAPKKTGGADPIMPGGGGGEALLDTY